MRHAPEPRQHALASASPAALADGAAAMPRPDEAGRAMDARDYRAALGSWATGVAVVTTRDDEGRRAGLTINSFGSVSLDPPLVSWNLGRAAPSLPVFAAARHWCVHVLAEGQEDLSRRFSTPAADKFAGIELGEGIGGVPLLPGCLARFECQHWRHYEGGDHLVLLGLVRRYDRAPHGALVYCGGYRRLAD